MPQVLPTQTRTAPSGKFSKVGWTDEAAASISEFRRLRWVMALVVEGC